MWNVKMNKLNRNVTLFFFCRFTWLGDGVKYPKVRSIRYPKERSINPNVTVHVVDLSVLKFINKIQIQPPSSHFNDSYVGNMVWLSPTDLSVTFTNREQTSALTVLCRAPTFNCTEVSDHLNSIWCFFNKFTVSIRRRFTPSTLSTMAGFFLSTKPFSPRLMPMSVIGITPALHAQHPHPAPISRPPTTTLRSIKMNSKWANSC